MIGPQKTGRLANIIIDGSAVAGLNITTRDGQPAQLAVIDANGNIIESGKLVAKEVLAVSVNIYRGFLLGNGHLRVLAHPPSEYKKAAA
jgi:hypothetical protein